MKGTNTVSYTTAADAGPRRWNEEAEEAEAVAAMTHDEVTAYTEDWDARCAVMQDRVEAQAHNEVAFPAMGEEPRGNVRFIW